MSLGFRPTFSLEIDCDSEETLKCVQARLANAPVILKATQIPGGGASPRGLGSNHFTLSVLESERHFWSPWLNVEILPHGDGTLLSGRFSPHPSVWTGFMFSYLALSMLGFFALIFAAALSMSGGTPWTLGLAGLCVALMVLLWWASQIGQRLAQDQMDSLQETLRSSLVDCDWRDAPIPEAAQVA